ncbi:hypothetical protein ACFLZ7_01995 [Nanoarchaeota archaeon]
MIFRNNSKDKIKDIKEELDDHLTAINENSSEIVQNGDHLVELEQKFEKLKEKVDEIHFMLSKITQPEDYELNENEKRVFMILYSIEQTPLSYSDIAVRTHQTELAVKAYIFSMINKGIPIVEMKHEDKSYFRLAKEFKDLQAKENVLKIDQQIVNSV